MSGDWDIAIVGAGTAGLPAAIVAARRGLRVLLIEAAKRIGGTLPISSGSLSAGGSPLAAARWISDSPERHLADCRRIGRDSANAAVLEAWVANAPDMLAWLLAEGVQFEADQPVFSAAHENYDVERTYTPGNGAQAYLDIFQRGLDEQIAAGRITLLLDTRMTGLDIDAAGAVRGVHVSGTDGPATYAARDTVLTTGGYGNGASLWRRFHKNAPHRVFAHDHCRGDGHEAAEAIGATLAYGENFLPTYGATQDIDVPDRYWIHTRVSPAHRQPWEIIVNEDGERFIAEDIPSPDARERALRDQPGQSFWVIYDEAIRRGAPRFFLWDDATVARAFAEGTNFKTAGSITDLASACGLPAARLQATINAYNAAQGAQADPLGRRHLPAPIATGPFYAIHHYSTSVVSWAGVVVDGDLRVLDAESRPIPHLYAAGEILGMGVFGDTFLGGATISSSLTFGRMLGERLGDKADQGPPPQSDRLPHHKAKFA